LLAHPAFQISDHWRTEFPPNSAALLGTLAIDRAFDLEQGVDATDRLKGQRRDRYRGFTLRFATGILGYIRHDEERAAGMDPAGRLQDRPRFAIRLVKPVVSAISVGLENPIPHRLAGSIFASTRN
jgi:hypothetical protein